MGSRRVNRSSEREFLERESQALRARLKRVDYLLPEFITEALRLPWCLITGPSTLSQFDSLAPPADLRARIEKHYNTTIAHLPDDRIVTILEHIHAIRDAAGDAPRS
jgi:hypothetical protein